MAAPIRHTCPNIDKTIKRLKTIREHMDDMVSHMNDMVKWVESELSDIEYELEELRSDNSSLRDWGHEQEDRVKELEEELKKHKEEVEKIAKRRTSFRANWILIPLKKKIKLKRLKIFFSYLICWYIATIKVALRCYICGK